MHNLPDSMPPTLLHGLLDPAEVVVVEDRGVEEGAVPEAREEPGLAC